MKNIYVKDIINLCHGQMLIGNELEKCNDFSKDTRTIKEGEVYVGIKGENFDGNKFYKEALAKGAKVCILEECDLTEEEKLLYHDKTIVIVNDSIETLKTLASYKRSMYDIPVIAVTGSVGKTSTKDIIANVLSQKYNVLKTEKNLNNHIGLPLTILKLKDHDCLVVEMGMNHFKEISKLTAIARPTIAVITNIGTAHIGNLGSRENILKAKLEILEGLSPDGKLIINNDNDLLNEYYDRSKIKDRIITIGINNESRYQATNIEESELDSNFDIGSTHIEVPVPGEVFIYNSLVAYATAKELDLTDEQIKEGIKTFTLSANRMSRSINKRGVTIIDDSYNASYDSVKSSIDLLAKSHNTRKIIVLGDMLELGQYSEEIHYRTGKLITSDKIDILITLGTLSKDIDKGALSNNFPQDNIHHFNNSQELLTFLDNELVKDDIILLKGSHAMGLTAIADNLKKLQ